MVRKTILRVGISGVIFGGPDWADSAAYADCGSDMQKLAGGRATRNWKSSITSCQIFFTVSRWIQKRFAGNREGWSVLENGLIAYMEKNKDWCFRSRTRRSPNSRSIHAKNMAFSAKACTVACADEKR